MAAISLTAHRPCFCLKFYCPSFNFKTYTLRWKTKIMVILNSIFHAFTRLLKNILEFPHWLIPWQYNFDPSCIFPFFITSKSGTKAYYRSQNIAELDSVQPFSSSAISLPNFNYVPNFNFCFRYRFQTKSKSAIIIFPLTSLRAVFNTLLHFISF